MTGRELRRPSEEDLAALVAHRDGTCISIYLPVEHGPAAPLNAIRGDLLLHACRDELAQRGLDGRASQQLLEPLLDLLGGRPFGSAGTEGLACFQSGGLCASYAVPVRTPVRSVVADRFYVKPLFALAGASSRYYVLALEAERMRLFAAAPCSIRELAVAGIPPGSFGLGAPPAEARALVDRWADRVAEAPAPVVLAGEEHRVTSFREMSQPLDLVARHVRVDPARLTSAELLALSWPVAAPRIRAKRHAAAERAKRLEGSLLVSHDMAEIVAAADGGRLDALFIPQGHSLWGRFDAASGAVEVFDEKRPDAVDLYDVAAARSYLTGTDIFVVDPKNVPGGAAVTATFRH